MPVTKILCLSDNNFIIMLDNIADQSGYIFDIAYASIPMLPIRLDGAVSFFAKYPVTFINLAAAAFPD